MQQYHRLVNDFDWQMQSNLVHTFIDSDWAGELPGRRSTSGGAVQLGKHLVETWSSTQNDVALSSGEAELYAIIKGASQALGIRSLIRDMGAGSRIRIFTDSTSGKSIASRRGLGRVRHIEVSNLWIQNAVQEGAVELVKWNNRFNSVDVLTKHLSWHELLECIRPFGVPA